jgi:hypothetical protein
MGFHKALYGLYLKMVVEMETSHWSGAVITPTTGAIWILLMVGVITDHSFSYHDICSQSIVG